MPHHAWFAAGMAALAAACAAPPGEAPARNVPVAGLRLDATREAWLEATPDNRYLLRTAGTEPLAVEVPGLRGGGGVRVRDGVLLAHGPGLTLLTAQVPGCARRTVLVAGGAPAPRFTTLDGCDAEWRLALQRDGRGATLRPQGNPRAPALAWRDDRLAREATPRRGARPAAMAARPDAAPPALGMEAAPPEPPPPGGGRAAACAVPRGKPG